MVAQKISVNRQPEMNLRGKPKGVKSPQEIGTVLRKIYGKLHQSKVNSKRYKQGKIKTTPLNVFIGKF
jgi:hypothetical protein